MTRFNFGKRSGIVLDACRTDGTWFDRGELDAAIAFVKAGGIEEEANAEPTRAEENASLRRTLVSDLRADAMEEGRRVVRAVHFANDLLSVLFGGFRR